jgi:hypothetical protein
VDPTRCYVPGCRRENEIVSRLAMTYEAELTSPGATPRSVSGRDRRKRALDVGSRRGWTREPRARSVPA